MPRTRSAATPPPRRSGTDRPRSVRGLTHRPLRSVKPVKKAKVPAKAIKVEPAEEPIEQLSESSDEMKQTLIQRHAAARAERHQSGIGAVGMFAVVVTCSAIFAAWWFLPDFFAKPDPIVPIPVASTAAVPTSAPSSSARPVIATSTLLTPTSTERRLLLPLK